MSKNDDDDFKPTILEGFQLSRSFADGKARIRDVELGERLGYRDTHTLRKFIESLFTSKRLNRSEVVEVTSETSKRGGRPGREFWLTRQQALVVVIRSEQPIAVALSDEIIAVFEAFLDGRLGSAPPAARSPLLADTFQPWAATWRREFMEILCELKGEQFTGRHPRWAARINSELYRLICGAEVYDMMRAENPKPHRGRNRHQQFTPEAKDRFALHLRIVESHLAVATSIAEWLETLRYLYEQQALQLALPMADSKRKKRRGESD
jgi:hypothetical protein